MGSAMAVRLVCIVLALLLGVSLGKDIRTQGKYQRLRALLNRRKNEEKGSISSRTNLHSSNISTPRKTEPKVEADTTQEHLQQLLDNIDLEDIKLYVQTTSTKRPYRFKPATNREQIRKQIKIALTTVQPSVDRSTVGTYQERKLSLNKVTLKKKPRKRSSIKRGRPRDRSINEQTRDKPKTTRLKVRRRKPILTQINTAPVDNTEYHEEKTTAVNIEPHSNVIKASENEQTPASETVNQKIAKPKETVQEQYQDIEVNDHIETKHPVFKSFPIVSSMASMPSTYQGEEARHSELLDKLQKDIKESEAAGKHKSHTDFMVMLDKIQKEQTFDLAAVQSEIDAMKLNIQFLKSTPTPELKIKEEASDKFSQNEAAQQVTAEAPTYQPKRLTVLIPTTPTTTARARITNRSRQETPRTKPEPRTPDTGDFSLLSWEQLQS